MAFMSFLTPLAWHAFKAPSELIARCTGRLLALGALGWLTGCTAMAPINPEISHAAPDSGYHMASMLKRQHDANHPHAMVLLAFSGGGTRAAALSYGVLEELKRTPVSAPGGTHSLLKEVDLIAGVSGGSFTALAYALYGDKLFDEFESRFLKRNVQGDLIERVVDPANWGKLGSATYGRSELAADYYDEILFHGATYADLLKSQSPVALVTGTDLSTGARFEFSQNFFDLMCSDLSSVRLARAAATSSAVPVVLTPVTFRNYGGHCDVQKPSWVQDVVDPSNRSRPAGRALLRAREIRDLTDGARRPYIHVVDGGISDNLGLRAMLEAFEQMEASPHFQEEVDFDLLKHIVVIVVNSRSDPNTDWDRSPTPPGMVAQLFQSSSVPIDHFSYESVELLKDIAQRWANQRELSIAQKRLAGMSKAQAEAVVPLITFDAIDVSFDAITDPEERRYFMNLPTSFVLPPEAVDRLRELGGRLLRDNPAFQVLLQRIDAAEQARDDTTPLLPVATEH
jgi:NTE family protein